MAYNNGPKAVTDGLVLALDAGNVKSYAGSGTVWNDLSGNGNNGTLTNGPTFNSGNGGSLVFDGVDDHVAINSVVLSGGGDFTVNCWIQANASETAGTVFANYPAGNLQVFYGNTAMGLWLDNASTYVDFPQPFISSTPVMITAMRRSNTTFFYQNGILLKTGNSTATIGSTSNFRIGENTVGTEEFTGTVHIVQVYNCALSTTEILQNFNTFRGRFRI